MAERYAISCGCSDKDRTVEIKEKLEFALWDRGPLHVRDVASLWPFKPL